jgi:hypothetical protein
VAHQGSRLSAVRWAQQPAVREVVGVGSFDEAALSHTLEAVAQRQDHIAQALSRRYVQRQGRKPVVFLYDVTSSYLEGEHNALGAYGYQREGKKGKRHMGVGWLTAEAGEPFAVRVFAGTPADPSTVSTAIAILKPRLHVEAVVFVGARGMGKAQSKATLAAERLRYITALTEPPLRPLLKRGVVQLGQCAEQVSEVQAAGRRDILRKNAAEARQAWHRLQDKRPTWQTLVATRKAQVAASPRCHPEAGWRHLQAWVKRHQLARVVTRRLDGRCLTVESEAAAPAQPVQLAGCDVLETDVPSTLLDTQTAHERYKALAHVDHDFRTRQTGWLEVRPLFVRKESRTRGHVFVCLLALNLSQALQQRLAAAFGTTQDEPHGVTVPDA